LENPESVKRAVQRGLGIAFSGVPNLVFSAQRRIRFLAGGRSSSTRLKPVDSEATPENLALHDVHEIPGILVEIQFQLVLFVHF
jgi:hypothetical protein